MAGKAERRTLLEHRFCDSAKEFRWTEVDELLKETPDLINAQPCKRWSALHQAAYEGNASMVSKLLKMGADVNALSRDGQRPVDVARGQAASVLKDHHACADATASEPELRVSVSLALSGEQLVSVVACHGKDTAEEFGQAVAKQDPAGGKHKYAILSGGRRLAPSETLSEAGIVDGASVDVVREKVDAVEVLNLDDVWESNPGSRYPVALSRALGDVVLHSTPECKHEDGILYSQDGYFVDREGRPTAYYRFINFIHIYVQNLRELHVLEVHAQEAKLGGIVILPAA